MKTLLMGAAAALLMTTTAFAGTVTGGVGVGIPTNDRDNGVAVSLGYHTDPTSVYGLEPGVEVLYTGNSHGSTKLGNVDTTQVDATVTKEFLSASKWTPYVEAGVGYADIEGSGGRGDSPTYLGAVGVNYKVSSQWSTGVKYEYTGSFDHDVVGNYNSNFYKQNVVLFTVSHNF